MKKKKYNFEIKNKFVAFIVFLIFFLIFWNILDLLFCKYISKTDYTFSGIDNLIVPLIISGSLGMLLFNEKKK